MKATPTPSKANYELDSVVSELLQKAVVRFTENSIRIMELECLGKSCTNLYVENRLILALVLYLRTKQPTMSKDIAVNCLRSIGLNKTIKSFNYFNQSCFRLLETGSYRTLEETGIRLLEGNCIGYTTTYTASCNSNRCGVGTFYSSQGNYIPVNSIVNNFNYE
jgi:hypothetical protein